MESQEVFEVNRSLFFKVTFTIDLSVHHKNLIYCYAQLSDAVVRWDEPTCIMKGLLRNVSTPNLSLISICHSSSCSKFGCEEYSTKWRITSFTPHLALDLIRDPMLIMGGIKVQCVQSTSICDNISWCLLVYFQVWLISDSLSDILFV